MSKHLGRAMVWINLCLPESARPVFTSAVLFLPALLIFVAQLVRSEAAEGPARSGQAGESGATGCLGQETAPY